MRVRGSWEVEKGCIEVLQVGQWDYSCVLMWSVFVDIGHTPCRAYLSQANFTECPSYM